MTELQTCSYCGTVPTEKDPHTCSSRGEAGHCSWFDDATRKRYDARAPQPPAGAPAAAPCGVCMPAEPSQALIDRMTASLNYDGLPPAEALNDADYDHDMTKAYRALYAALAAAPESAAISEKPALQQAIDACMKAATAEYAASKGMSLVKAWVSREHGDAIHANGMALRRPDVHLSHCYQGEYDDCCKYGDADCPAAPTPSPDANAVREALESLACIARLCDEDMDVPAPDDQVLLKLPAYQNVTITMGDCRKALAALASSAPVEGDDAPLEYALGALRSIAASGKDSTAGQLAAMAQAGIDLATLGADECAEMRGDADPRQERVTPQPDTENDSSRDDWQRLERAFSAAHDFISKQSEVDYDSDFPQPNGAFDLCAILTEAMPSLYAFKPKCSDCAARYANTGGCRDCEGP